MGKFRMRLNEVPLEVYDFTPTTHQLIRLLRRKSFYDAVPALAPLWRQALLYSNEISRAINRQRADNSQMIWERYKDLERRFLDIVRELQESGREQELDALKPEIKRWLNIETKWLVFHCPLEDGKVLHVMV